MTREEVLRELEHLAGVEEGSTPEADAFGSPWLRQLADYLFHEFERYPALDEEVTP